MLGGDFEIIPTPGHTPGATAFLWNRHLFTGDTVFLRDGEWVAAVLDDSDPDAYIESLELMKTLDFDTLVPWASTGQYYRRRRRTLASASTSSSEQSASAPQRARRAVRAELPGDQRAARVEPAGGDVDPVLVAAADLDIDMLGAPGRRRGRAVVHAHVPRLGVGELPLHGERPGRRRPVVDGARH